MVGLDKGTGCIVSSSRCNGGFVMKCNGFTPAHKVNKSSPSLPFVGAERRCGIKKTGTDNKFLKKVQKTNLAPQALATIYDLVPFEPKRQDPPPQYLSSLFQIWITYAVQESGLSELLRLIKHSVSLKIL